MLGFDRIVCVDWGKELARRRAWAAEPGARRLAPLEVTPTVAGIVERVRAMPGRTLIGIDAALGVPRAYFDAARAVVPGWRAANDFLSWLPLAVRSSGFESAACAAAEWRHDRPFIAVPAGRGTLTAFWQRTGGPLLRRVDAATGAKSPFIVSGIPGTVGSGTRALWRELAAQLSTAPELAVWPFHGALAAAPARVVLAEIYPRVCYSVALASSLPSPLRPIAKTLRAKRLAATTELLATPWVRVHRVAIESHGRALDSEDDFDAMISAAALLRCAIEERPLECAPFDPVEGGILGMASLELSSRSSRVRHRAR